MDGWIDIPMMKYAEEEQVLCQLASTLYRSAELHQGRSIHDLSRVSMSSLKPRHYFDRRKPALKRERNGRERNVLPFKCI